MVEGFQPADYALCGITIVMAVLGLFRGFSGTLAFVLGAIAAVFTAMFGWPFSATLTETMWMRGAGVLVATVCGYWAMLHLVAPDAPAGADSFSLAGCFPGYLDRLFTPGHLYLKDVLEPSGPFVSFFGFPTALLGMLAGDIVRCETLTPRRRVGALALTGVWLLVLGLLLGYFFFLSGSMLVNITAHFANNAFCVVMYYLYNRGLVGFSPSEPMLMPESIVVSCSVGAALLLVIYFVKLPQKNSIKIKR